MIRIRLSSNPAAGSAARPSEEGRKTDSEARCIDVNLSEKRDFLRYKEYADARLPRLRRFAALPSVGVIKSDKRQELDLFLFV